MPGKRVQITGKKNIHLADLPKVNWWIFKSSCKGALTQTHFFSLRPFVLGVGFLLIRQFFLEIFRAVVRYLVVPFDFLRGTMFGYPIFLATFKKADLPRKLIPAGIMAASCTFPLSMLPGGAQLNNIIPTQYIGTTPMAAPLVSMAASIVTAVLLFLYFRYEFALARRRGEHFEAEGDILRRIEQFEKDPGLRPWTSVFPMVLIILLINLFGMDLSYAVLAGTALALALGWKNLPDKLRTLNDGIAKVGPAMVITAASVGFGGTVLACAGAQTILKAIASLPVDPTVSLSLAASFAGVLTGNGGGGTDVAMDILSAQYLAMGVHPEILHRVVAIATAGFSCLPHNGMLITVSDTCGFSAKECYRYIFISTVLTSLAGLIVTVALGCVCYPIG